MAFIHTHTYTHRTAVPEKLLWISVALLQPQPSPPLCQDCALPAFWCRGYVSGFLQRQKRPAVPVNTPLPQHTYTDSSQYTVACFPALNNPQCQLQPRCPPARASLMSNKGHIQRVYVWADLMCVCVFKGTRGLALNPVTQLPLQSDGPKDPHQQMYRAATASRANRKKYHLRLSQSACVCRGSMCL